MLRPRLIPSLLIHNKGLVKTQKFTDPRYVGDPLNAVKIFNEKQVDELFIADIDATRLHKAPDFELIAKLAAECRMPLAYAGGVKKVEQIERIISLGVEKVGISSAAIKDLSIISAAAEKVGNQSILGIIDVKKSGLLNRYEVFVNNGMEGTGLRPRELALKMEQAGAGEVLLNSIDHDGMMLGYDFDLIEDVISNLTIPLTVVGGAGSHDHFKALFDRFGLIGASAGSFFVFKGRFRAVLIQYPDLNLKESLFPKYHQ